MEKKKGRVENLSVIRDTETAKARGKLGGIKSGEVKRQNRLARELYAEYFNKKYDVEIKGKKKTLSGFDLCLEMMPIIMCKGDAASIAMLKEADRVQMEDLERNRVTDNELKIIIDDGEANADKN